MKRTLAIVTVLCTAIGVASAGDGNPINTGSANPTTLAVFGDWPYSTTLLNEAPRLIDSINSDPKVRLVLFVGDIHSGSMPCTGAGLNPPPPVSAPDWNIGIYNIFQQFKDPLVYTPGDNEWADCQKPKEGNNVVGSGAPLNELAAVRSLFFADPGHTLGQRPMRVVTQAQAFDPAHPEDAQFVENVLWEESQVVFVTLNVPGGSNDDAVEWKSPFTDDGAQLAERTAREAANLRWIDKAFDQAEADNAAAVLIGLQADMWDPEAIAPGGAGLTNYTPLVTEIANRSVAFNRPVLLINGDTHVFEVDHPLADPTSATGQIHNTQSVPNLTRITVEGSTDADEWLRLTIDPRAPGIFSWQRVQYLP
jgi:hypothetical protein